MQTKDTKFEETAIIIRQEEIADDIYSMWLRTEHIAAHAKAGQFVSVYCNEGSRLLPRPISICEIDRKDGAIRLVYRVAGKGTAEFSGMRTGMQLKVVGPLGNGFPQKNKKAFLIGGGIGIPPMLELAKELDCEKQIVLGFRDELFLLEDFRNRGQIYIATEDGSAGTEGNVLDAIRENGLDADMTPYDEVQQFDVANFDKKSIDALATAETVTRETEVEQEAEIAQERIKKSRPARKKNEKKAVNSQQSNELGLFDDLIDNNKNNEHGLQRTDAERSEGLSANGNRHGQGLSRGTETGSESEQQAGRGTDNEGERTSDAVNRIVRPRLSDAITEKKNTHNNHSERGKDHAPTSVDARIEANIKAIELAKQLLESGERATEKQMQTLRKFSGWGGLGKAFNEGTSYAPNPIAKKLRELLGEKAYQEAVMSANSAYYTPAYVVDTLWDIAEQMGFNGGNILEGSAGIGNILGQMPTNISERSDIHAIEIDGTSGGILSLLYPDAKVEIQGFEQTRIPNGSVDLAITNVPFVTGLRVNDTTGDIIEKTPLVTRIRTPKNEVVTVPNSFIMSSHTVNYSTSAREYGLIIHSEVSIGYDVPWRQVNQILIDAALNTPGVVDDPRPFVLETSLSDWYPVYQINAYIKEAHKMSQIYSDLHQTIQDKFNEAGIEIMSPHYMAVRDGNATTTPKNDLSKSNTADTASQSNKSE